MINEIYNLHGKESNLICIREKTFYDSLMHLKNRNYAVPSLIEVIEFCKKNKIDFSNVDGGIIKEAVLYSPGESYLLKENPLFDETLAREASYKFSRFQEEMFFDEKFKSDLIHKLDKNLFLKIQPEKKVLDLNEEKKISAFLFSRYESPLKQENENTLYVLDQNLVNYDGKTFPVPLAIFGKCSGFGLSGVCPLNLPILGIKKNNLEGEKLK